MEPALSLLPLKATTLHTIVIHLGAAQNGTLSIACGRAIRSCSRPVVIELRS